MARGRNQKTFHPSWSTDANPLMDRAVGLAGSWMTVKNMRASRHGPWMNAMMGVAGAVAGGFISFAASSDQHRTTYSIPGALLARSS